MILYNDIACYYDCRVMLSYIRDPRGVCVAYELAAVSYDNPISWHDKYINASRLQPTYRYRDYSS